MKATKTISRPPRGAPALLVAILCSSCIYTGPPMSQELPDILDVVNAYDQARARSGRDRYDLHMKYWGNILTVEYRVARRIPNTFHLMDRGTIPDEIPGRPLKVKLIIRRIDWKYTIESNEEYEEQEQGM